MKTATAFALVLVVVSCGGSRTGDEGLFAGDPLPPPEPDAPSDAADAKKASGGPCAEPAGGFPVCASDGSNSPCVVEGAACFLQCERCAAHPCPAAQLVPWKCTSSAPASPDAASSAPVSPSPSAPAADAPPVLPATPAP